MSDLFKKKMVDVTREVIETIEVLQPQWDLIPTGTKVKGVYFKTEFEGRIVKDAYDSLFLCTNQERFDGAESYTKLGFKYSYCISRGTTNEHFYFTEIELDPDFVVLDKMPILVGGYTATFHEGYVKVGCTRIENSEVEAVFSSLIKAK